MKKSHFLLVLEVKKSTLQGFNVCDYGGFTKIKSCEYKCFYTIVIKQILSSNEINFLGQKKYLCYFPTAKQSCNIYFMINLRYAVHINKKIFSWGKNFIFDSYKNSLIIISNFKNIS